MSRADAAPAVGAGTRDPAPRLDALADAVRVVRRHVDAGVGSDVAATLARAESIVKTGRERLRHGAAHTVVALVGTTGSGKSSLLNALAGQELARAGVTRPTTSVTQSVAFGDGSSPSALLDWLGVSRRHAIPGPAELDGLVLLDLPDFDSVELAHQLEVDRLIEMVDLMVWVTDPQKYADEAWHAGYLRPHAGHEDVLEVLLNKVDLLPDEEAVQRCLDDLHRLLVDDGLETVSPIPVSAATGHGIDGLMGLLAGEVSARQAMLDRLDADLRVAADGMAVALGIGGGGRVPGAVPTELLVEGLARAVGVPDTAALVARQHRQDAAVRTGWPPTRWVRRWRRAPISRLPRAERSPVARAEVATALRATGREVAGDGSDPWSEAVRAELRSREPVLVGALDRQTGRQVQAARSAPRWWSAAGRLQSVLLSVALVGLVWLVGLGVVDLLLRIDPEPLTVRIRGVPLPTLLLVGGVALGLLLAGLARLLARRGAARAARRITRGLHAAIADTVEADVVDPLDLLLEDRRTVAELLLAARGGDDAGSGRTGA